ncbi:MAG: hypothetical protein RSE41_01855 [Clostridia bacterium]
MEIYNTKLKKCGNIIKIKKYEKKITRGYKRSIIRQEVAENQVMSEEDKEQKRYKDMIKSRNDFIDKINYNFTIKDTFITLTYESNELDPEQTNKDFDNFIRKLKYHYGKDIKYAYVKSKQYRGAYHYHVVTDIKFIDYNKLNKLWKYGNIHIDKIKNVNGVGLYMANNISKEELLKKEYKKKIFQTSRTCEDAKWIYGDKAEIIYNALIDSGEKPIYNKNFNTQYLDNMEIIIYKIE